MRRRLRRKQRQGAWTGAAADTPAADAPAADVPAATSEAATGSWTGAAADAPAADALAANVPAPDAPAATSEAPTMGMSFFFIAGVFSSGFFRREVEKMMGQERQLQ
jgi:hypothetical protein